MLCLNSAGDYSAESLLEMIALHLDASHAECTIWKEFASCFLKLSLRDEDTLSACLDGNDGVQKQRFSVRYNRTPEIFTERKSGKAWRLRCRWWLKRHFSNNMLASEIVRGNSVSFYHRDTLLFTTYGLMHYTSLGFPARTNRSYI